MAESGFVRPEQVLASGRAPRHPVAHRDGQTLCFGDFELRVAAWCAAFECRSGERWALYLEDTFEAAAALFGAWHAGKCVYLPGDAQPATLRTLSDVVDGFAGELPSAYEPLRPPEMKGEPRDWAPLSPNQQALVLFTSGSTGAPMPVPKRLAQLSNEVATLAELWDETLDDGRVLSTVSHQHIYGLLFRMLWPLCSGRTFEAFRLLYPEDVVAALQRGEAALVASPAHLKRLPEHLDWSAVNRSLKAVFTSGGPLSSEALPGCRALLGRAPLEIFGSSETGGLAWRQRTVDDDAPWKPLPGVHVRVEEDALSVRSPHIDETQWYRTADRVRMLPSGGFQLLGRADRIEKLEEKRVSLTGLEQALLQSGLLREARVVPLEGRRRTLGVVGVPSLDGWKLYDERGKRSLNLALRQSLASGFEASVLPRSFRYLEAMPANSQGKSTDAMLTALFDPRRPELRVLERSPETARVQVRASASSPFFDGHFAGNPILPGVTQVDWALRLGRELFPLPAAFLRMEALKFQQVIPPEALLTFELTWSADKGSLGFKIASDAGPHAGGRLVFGPMSEGQEQTPARTGAPR